MRFRLSSPRDALVLAIALALAGCEGARAQGPAEQGEPAALDGVVAVPADWKPQPAIAAAAAKAVEAAGGEADVAVWGEAGLGCFVAVVSARAARQNPEDALEELRAALGEQAGLAGWTVAAPADARGTIARASLRGEVRGGAAVAPPKGAAVTVAACFYNQREPATCQAQCKGVLDSLDATKVKP